MTVDSNKDQTQCELIDDECSGDEQTIGMSTMMTTTTASHYVANTIGSSSQDASSELTARLTQIQLRDGRHQTKSGYSSQSLAESMIPRRQPTIVCEDIADDIEIESCDEEEQNASIDQSGAYDVVGRDLLPRSASTASLTVPQSSIETEKRPPLHTDNPNDQMSIETTDASDIALSSTANTTTNATSTL